MLTNSLDIVIITFRENKSLHRTLRIILIQALILLLLLASFVATNAQGPATPEEMRQEFIVALNASLPDSFLPFAQNVILDAVAQPLADSLCDTGEYYTDVDYHPIPDYAWYPTSGPQHTYFVIRSFDGPEYTAHQSAKMIILDEDRVNGVHYREVGMGIRQCGNETIYFLFFAAQPNIMPIIINNGEKSLTVDQDSINATLHIHEEQIRAVEPGVFGHVASMTIRVNDAPDMTYDVYQQHIPIQLICGTNVVVATLIDTQGKQVESQTAIDVICSPTRTTNHSPIIDPIDEQNLTVNDSRTVPIVVHDIDDDPLTLSVVSSDSSIVTATLDGNCMILTALAPGTAQVTISASDGELTTTSLLTVDVANIPNSPTQISATASPNLVTTVIKENSPPRISSIPDQILQVGESLSVTVTVTDNDDDPLTLGTTANDPAIVTTHLADFILTLTGSAPGDTQVTVNASDGRTTVSTTVNVTVHDKPNTPPEIAVIGDQVLTVNQSRTIGVVASDADGDPLTYSVSSGNTVAVTAAQAGNMVTITGLAPGFALITVTVSDGQDSTTQTFNTHVQEPPNSAPVISAIGNQVLKINESVMVKVGASDADGDLLTLGATADNPAVVTVTLVDTTLMIAGTAPGTTQITVSASDGKATTTSTFTVTVQANKPPQITSIDHQVLKEHETRVLTVVVSDEDNQPLTVSAMTDNPAIVTTSLNNTTLTLMGIAPGTAQITISASDGQDTITSTFSVDVQGNIPPQIDRIDDQDITIGNPQHVIVSAHDADGDQITLGASVDDSNIVSVSITDSVLTISGNTSGTTQITISASDGQNTTTSTFNVDVQKGPISGDCANTASNDWNAPVYMRLTWNENALTISFDTEADCIWLYPLSFDWGGPSQPVYHIVDDPDYQGFRNLYPAAISFAGWPADHCLQIQAGSGDGVPMTTNDCPDFNKIHVTNDRFHSPLEFFFSTAVGQFSVLQNGVQIKICQAATQICGTDTDPIQWENSAPHHQGAPVEAGFYPDTANGNILIEFNSMMQTVDIRNMLIAWVNMVRTLQLHDYGWLQGGVREPLNFGALPASTCLILRVDVNSSASNQHINTVNCGLIYVASGVTQPFWDMADSPEGFAVTVDGVNFPDNLRCPRGPDVCTIRWRN